MPPSIRRRDVLLASPLAFIGWLSPTFASAVSPFNFSSARQGYLDRVEKFRSAGILPIIDIESSYNPLEIDLRAFTASMDRAGIAVMCLSADQPGKFVNQGTIWSDHALEAAERYPSYFIPTGNGANHPAWTKSPEIFLSVMERWIVEHRYPMLGEFEVRHYPSPRQIQRGETYRDVQVPIDGPLMERVFRFAEKTGLPFQIHYEIEDELLPPLEQMLTKFPKAKVIWCHLAQIRFQQRSTKYGAQMVNEWLDRFPNLYFDTAFGNSASVYQPSGERHARYWSNPKDWAELIAARPYRFLAALDIGGDRMNRVEEWAGNLRQFLGTLPLKTQEVVAYKAAWRLLFNEEI